MKPPISRLARSYRLLIAMALAAPAVLFMGAAWKSRIDALRAGEDEITRSLVEMRDHVQVVLEEEEVALVGIDDHIRNLSWIEIAKPNTSIFLRKFAAEMVGVESIKIANSEGFIQAASEKWEPGARVAEQEFFAADRQRGVGTYLSTAFTGTPPRIASVDMVRRRYTTDGSFDGTIHFALSSEYLGHIFSLAAPPVSHDVLLLRSDGEIMTREPESSGMRASLDGPLMQHITGHSGDHIVADRERLYSYQQIPGYPVYLSLGVSESAILQRWYGGLMVYGTAAFGAALALMSVSWVAFRRAQSEQLVLTQLNAESKIGDLRWRADCIPHTGWKPLVN